MIRRIGTSWLFCNSVSQRLFAQIGEVLFIMASVLLTMLPISPWNMVNPRRDSGVFLYIGWRILNGELPYRDIWDHKPPVIFYLNALGVAISGNSRWGIWLIELVFLSLAAWLGFQLFRKIFGTGPAALASFLWLLTLEFVIQGGNLTTEYTLLIQFSCLALIQRAAERPSPWLWFLLGVLTALAFFTKQNTVGIGIALLIYLGVNRIRTKQSKKIWKEVGLFVLGWSAISVAITAFFAAQKALPDFWSAAFQYNFSYVSSPVSLKTRLKHLISDIEPLTTTGLFQIALVGYVIGFLALLYKRAEVVRWQALLLVGILDLPVELILVNLSNRGYPHYYMALLPILALFAGLLFRMLFLLIKQWTPSKATSLLFTLGSLLAFAWGAYMDYRKQVAEFRDTEPSQLAVYLQDTTSSEDFVLLWGANASNNFLAQRRSPTRFVYQYPLYAAGYTKAEMVEEFLEDILRTRPLIVDTMNPKTPMYQFPVTSEKIRTAIAFLQTHYCLEKQTDGWIIYKYQEEPCRKDR